MKYVGTELDVFQHAVNWKQYWGSKLAPHVSGDVCEVGAGIGGSTTDLYAQSAISWTLLEPDQSMADRLLESRPTCLDRLPWKVSCKTLKELPINDKFDTISYIDVLEHIEEDGVEIAEAYSRLRPGGVIVALSPACMKLYSEFDKSVGHWRRYSLESIHALFKPHFTILASGYLDLPGALLSLANRVLLRQSNPSLNQITFWDRWVIPCARYIDPILNIRLGRSVYIVAKKLEASDESIEN